ncbi:MAG: ATP-binding cassette domain-containing protein [Candidatus Binataceae bacterium]|nr:ATP-binding cassette domain-containing protein [Candidatus Binataceae bacterium]
MKKNPAPPSPRPRRKNSSTPVIRVAGLRVERDALILDAIDWTVARGEHWVILGANGSGKTSLLSTLTGYMALSGGEISVLGETYGRSDWRELRKRIGICSSAINHLMEGHETALAAVIGGRHAMVGMWGEISASDRAAATRILKQIEAGKLRDRPWRFLSQGERQRVMIGRALMARPQLLILDEPCAGLDPVAREHFVQFIERLARRRGSPTLVLVTHHVEEIMPAFTHVLVLKGGAVLAAGPKREVLTSRVLSTAFTAALRLSRKRGRYALAVRAAPTAII